MIGTRAGVLLAAAVSLLDGCSRSKDVDIGLEPEPFTIVTGESASTGSGGILVEPNALGGTSYSDNKEDIEDVTLTNLTLEVVSVNTTSPANQATKLQGFSFTITDTVTLATHGYVAAATGLDIAVGRYGLGLIAPADPGTDPSIDAFLTDILKAGDAFFVVATATVDQPPVNITCRLLFDVELHVKVSFP